MNTIILSEIKKNFTQKHNSIEQTLKELQKKGYINSQGECSIENAIMSTTGFSVEYFYTDETSKIKYLLIGLKDQSGRSEKILTISETGKLYLSNI